MGTAKLAEVSVSCPLAPSPGVSGLSRPEYFRWCPTQGPPFQERHFPWSYLMSPAGLWDTLEERASPSVYWSAASRVTGQWDQGDWLVPVSGKTFSFQGQLPMSCGCARTPEPALEDSLGKRSSLGRGLRGGKPDVPAPGWRPPVSQVNQICGGDKTISRWWGHGGDGRGEFPQG